MLFFPRHVDGDRTNHTDLRPLICVALGMKVVGWLFGFVLLGPLLLCLCFWVVGCFVYLGLICGWFFCFIVCVDCFGLHFCWCLIHSQVSLLSIVVG